MIKGITKMLSISILLQFKMVIIYYCLYSAVVYNFMMNLILDPKLPSYFKDNDRIILLLLAIISAYSFNNKLQTPPTKVKPMEESLNILKPGQKII